MSLKFQYPLILTGWQAAREIENIVDEPGDDKYYYGLLNPPTLEEYLELLRTVWEDRLFVMAGGLDHAIGAGLGNLREICPLELDIYGPTITCPPMMLMTEDFILRCDRHPLGLRTPGPDPGGEYIDWPDTFHYPIGFPSDDFAFNEQEWALWDITDHIADICAENDFSMRVRVTDHVDNWVRSGEIEMRTGVPMVDADAQVDALFFYAADDNGFPEFLYTYCDEDCDDPQSCNPDNTFASSIEWRDEEGYCILHLVAFCSSLNYEMPSFIPATFTSNEPHVPEAANPVKYEIMLPLSEQAAQPFLALYPYTGGLCADGVYVCDLLVTDDPGVYTALYVSHSDEAYTGYPFSEECEDYTIIYDPRYDQNDPHSIDFVRLAQEYAYGHKRGQGLKCTSYDDSYYSEDRFIQNGGMHAVFGTVENRKKSRPVQSAADLIIISSHAVYAEPPGGGNNQPTGIAQAFIGRMGGCKCPPPYNPLRDSPYFSPVYANINNRLYDNDFQDDTGDMHDFDGLFWQHQASHDRVTWVVMLGCGILNPSNTFGYTPLLEWSQHIGKAKAICGYADYGIAWDPLNDFIGTNFSSIIKLNFTQNEDLYICNPPAGYFYRPISAWMEANCKAANDFDYDMDDEEILNRQKILCSQARAIDMDGNVWQMTYNQDDNKFYIDVN